MSKKLDPTPKMLEALAKSTSGAVKAADVSIYETIALNTLPISQNGLFQGATVTESTLHAMAEYVNAGENVPLHTMHDQTSNLPVGKTFMAGVFKDANGMAELRAQFYLPNTETELISKLETDTIGEVSVGLQPLHMNCSECGWDYRGPDATWMNLYEKTCANDHTLGENGVHLILNGLERFRELSLVSLGAANRARIQARTKALMGQEDYSKLAASGTPPELITLFANYPLKKENEMDMTVLIAQLTDSKALAQTTTAQLTATQASLVSVQAELKTANEELVALKAKETPEIATLKAAVKTAEDNAKIAYDAVFAEASRLCVALSLAAPAEKTELPALLSSITENRKKMTETFTKPPVTEPARVSVPTSSFKGA